MTKQLSEYTRLNADSVQELRKGDTIIFIGHEGGEEIEGASLGTRYLITSDFGDKNDFASSIVGPYADFVDDDEDDSFMSLRNCGGFAKVE